MLHPHTRIKWISDDVGYGIFATQFIPKGTITYVEDSLDIVIPKDQITFFSGTITPIIDRYSYINGNGDFVVSWDFGKYMNHCCYPNTLTTGYGFEIAIKNIHEGEEITDDYGLFTDKHPMNIVCNKENCRKVISSDSFDSLVSYWDSSIRAVLPLCQDVEQPLLEYIESDTLLQLDDYFRNHANYVSVSTLKTKDNSDTNMEMISKVKSARS